MDEITRRNIGPRTGQLEMRPHSTEPHDECMGHIPHSSSHIHVHSSVLQVLIMISSSSTLAFDRTNR